MKARANAPLQVPQARPDAKADTAEANEALKERLARQEAATKLFDKSKPEPAAIRAEPAAARAEPARSEPAPQRQTELVKTAAAAPAPAPAPAKLPEAAPAKPKVENVKLASAAPTTLPAPLPLAAKLVSRVDPDFPREAVQAGADHGNVKARMTLDANGNVTRVEVVEANPRRIFDRAVVRALSQWRFSDGPSGRTVETEVEFRMK
jgi:protein TonB